MDKRSFLKNSGLAGLGGILNLDGPDEMFRTVSALSSVDPGDKLFENYIIFTAPIDGAGVPGCRITPNVHTSIDEPDVLVRVFTEFK